MDTFDKDFLISQLQEKIKRLEEAENGFQEFKIPGVGTMIVKVDTTALLDVTELFVTKLSAGKGLQRVKRNLNLV